MAIVFYDSAMIGEIAKSKEYRDEPYRIRPTAIGFAFHGRNHEHYLIRENGCCRCDCDFYAKRGLCSHSMTIEWWERNSDEADVLRRVFSMPLARTQPVPHAAVA